MKLNIIKSFIIINITFLYNSNINAQPNHNNKVLEAYFNNNAVVLEEEGEITKFITPKLLSDHGNFQIRISRPKALPEEPKKVITLGDKIEARRIMHEANQTFFNGEIAKTWELVAQAEDLDPDYYRIKTMKGSLLYKIGSKNLALEVWMESLAQNPDQPEILAVIKGQKTLKSQVQKIMQARKRQNENVKKNF